MENEPLQAVRKLVAYSCDSYEKRKFFQEKMERAGAIVEDYRFNFVERTAVFRFSLRVPLEVFSARLDRLELDFQILALPSRNSNTTNLKYNL